MKSRYRFSCFRWSLIIILVVLLLSPAFPSNQAKADDYGDLIAQAQAIRQQLAQLLAAYNSMDANGRAMMDAAMAQGAQQALQQIYASLSASDRAYMDAQCRQATGYSMPQLMQASSTVPGMVSTLDLILANLGNLSAGVAVAPPNPNNEEPKKEPETKNVTLTLYVHQNMASGPIIPGAQVSGQDAKGKAFSLVTNSKGYVTITGATGLWSFSASRSGYETNSWRQTINVNATKHAYLILKGLAWQLFPGKNLTDAEARKKLQDNITLQRNKILEAKAAAEKELEIAKKAKASDPRAEALIANLKEGLATANKDSDDASYNLKIHTLSNLVDLAKEGKIKIGDNIEQDIISKYSDARPITDVGQYLADITEASGPIQDFMFKEGDHTFQDYLNLTGGVVTMIGAVNDMTVDNKVIKAGIVVGTLLQDVMMVGGSEWEAYQYRKALEQTIENKQANDLLFQHRIDLANMKIQEYNKQLERLKREGGYIDPKYLNAGQ